MHRGRMSSPSRPLAAPLVWRAWLGVGAWASASGWILSLGGWLGARGYAVAAVAGMVVAAVAWRGEFPAAFRGWRKPWRRAAPLGFAVVALLAIAGGAIHAPSNWDTFWYRLPRVLHWLDAGRWHWIDTPEGRFNFLANGMEWLHAPLLAWTGSYRLLFLPNAAAFLLLPGLFLAVFRGFGVRARTAWWWMWLAPTGWVYASQAGSVANDLISAVDILAAVVFALRARRNGRFGDVAWCAIACALLTNAKQTNLPLLLPVAVLVFPALPILWKRPAAAFALVAIATLASLVPITVANIVHTGHWSGWSPAERNFVPSHPMFAIAANTVILVVHDLLPPWVPGAGAMNHAAAGMAATIPEWVRGFEFFAAVPTSFDEAWAGPGMFVTLLLLPVVFGRGRGPIDAARGPTMMFAGTAIAIASLVLLAQMGCRQPARYLAPYFPLVLALALRRPAAARLVRVGARAWPAAAMIAFVGAAFYVALLKVRPIVPVRAAVAAWVASHPDHALSRRLQGRLGSDGPPTHPVESFLPALGTTRTIGLAAVAAGEPYLWDARAGRRVVHVPRTPDRAFLDRAGLEFVVIDDLAALYGGQPDGLGWAAAMGGEVVASSPLDLVAARARRAAGGLPTIDDLAYQRSRDGSPAVDNFYLVRRVPSASIARP